MIIGVVKASITPTHKCERVLHAHFESGKLQLDFDEQLDENFDDEIDVEDLHPSRALEGEEDRRILNNRRYEECTVPPKYKLDEIEFYSYCLQLMVTLFTSTW